MCTIRKRKRIFLLTDSSDSSSEPILSKELEAKYKNLQENAQTMHKRHSSNGSNLINDNKVPQKTYTQRIMTSDSRHTEVPTRNKKKRYINRSNGGMYFNSNETSSDSSLSSIQTRKLLKSKEKRDRSDKIEIIGCDHETDYEYIENSTSDSNLFVASTFKQNIKETQAKQRTTETQDTQDTQDTQSGVDKNFKPAMIKIGEKLKKKFSVYEQFINRLQLKYIKDDTLIAQDAIDMLFIFNCIISKLKEELTDQQQDLANCCIQWSTQHECNHSVSQKKDKEYVNGKSLHVENGTNSQINSSSSTILSGNIFEKDQKDVADKNKALKINVDKKEGNKSSLQTSSTSPRILQCVTSNITLRKNDRITNNTNVSTEMNIFKVPQKSPTVYSTNMKNSTPNPKLLNQDFTEMLELSSDCEADTSDNELVITQQLPYFRNNDKHKNNSTDLCKTRSKTQSKSPFFEVSKEQLNNDFQTQASYNSDDTIIIPRKEMPDHSKIEDGGQNSSNKTTERYIVFSSNENLISPQQSKLVISPQQSKLVISPQQSKLVISSIDSVNTNEFVSNHNNKDSTSNVNSNNKTNIADKKLKMNCKVLVPKC